MVKFGLVPDDDHHHSNSSCSNSSGSSSNPRHFFIPIHSSPSSTTTLQPFCIPKAFMKYLQIGKKKIKKKSHEKRREVVEAILRSNGRGKSFHVDMVMDKDGRLMSDDEHEHHQQVEEDMINEDDEYVQQARGWKNFSDYHDLHVGDFLLFRHLGSLSFDVIVFDSTTCQRKYPPWDPPFFFFDHATTGKSSKTIATTPGQSKRADDAASAGSYSSDDAASAGSSDDDDDDIPSNQFTTTLKHYTFSQWMMNFPVKFVRSNGLGNKTCTITFRDEKGRSWPIGFRYKKNSGVVYIYRGWRQFIEGNGLKEGDVCTFELVSLRGTKNIIFDVHRGSKTTTPEQTKRAAADGAAAAGNSNENTPLNKFTTRLKHYNFSKWTMTIPAEFVRSNGLVKKNCTITFRDEKGRSWPVKLRNYGNSQVTVCGGWRQFIKGNGLEEGDVCTFELVSRRGGTKNIVFDVYRGSKGTAPDQAKRADVDTEAGSFNDDDDRPPNQFTTPLRHYHFSQWAMNFPSEFVRSNALGNKTCAITFRDEKGRSWPIGLRCKKSSGQVYVRGGWREFIEGNGLKEGDICTFELVSRRGGTKNIVFDVRRGSKTTTHDHAKRADAAGAAAADSSNECIPLNMFTTRLKYFNFSQSTMTIPSKFVRSNGLDNKTCMITFRDEKGRSWPIKLGKKGGNQVYVHGGWRQFIKGNGLKEGDVCTFELVSRQRGTKNIVFDVRRDSKTTTPGQAKRADDAASVGSYSTDDATSDGSYSTDDDTPSNQFSTTLKHYTFSQWMMTLPAKFVRSNGLGNKNRMITFRDGKKRSWPIGLRYKKSSGEVYIYGGWRQFIVGNGFKEGDVCTFELVSRQGTKNIIFDVHRGSKTTSPEQTKRADADGVAAAGSPNENTPSNKFTTCLKHYNFSKWTMTIPAEFVRSNGLRKKNCTITFRDEKGRSWPINLRNHDSGQVQVHGGWRQFIRGNGLEEGDVCTFELVSWRGGTKNIVFDVYRGSKGTAPDQAKRADVDAAAGSLNDDDDDDDRPPNQFTTPLRPYNFSQWVMTFPTEFVRSNGLGNKTCTITFRDEKGRSWPIGLRCKKSSGQVYVRGGWRQFIGRNGLKVGDVCTFELVSRQGGTNNIVFDVRRGHH